MVFSRAFCFDLIIKGDKAAREACAEISPFFGLVGRTDLLFYLLHFTKVFGLTGQDKPCTCRSGSKLFVTHQVVLGHFNR